jgi:putative spermidine/putrescine transport system permease protein
VTASAPTSADRSVTGAPYAGAGPERRRHLGVYAGVVPFFVYIAIFLLLPTLLVVVGAFQTNDGAPTMGNIESVLTRGAFIDAFGRSIWLSVVTALAGSLLGGLLSWAVATGDPAGRLRPIVVAASGVLAQFGGVMLAFAFLATFGINGFLTIALENVLGFDARDSSGWLYGMNGLAVVYTYFQIPLMLIVFLPALDGLRREWRDASESLGGTSWSYWRHIAGPILAPSFLGAFLLLFTNAFSAYATAAALISQGSPIVPLQISTAMTSEVVLGQANVGKALALGMIIVVAVVMTLYALVQRRASRWVK